MNTQLRHVALHAQSVQGGTWTGDSLAPLGKDEGRIKGEKRPLFMQAQPLHQARIPWAMRPRDRGSTHWAGLPGTDAMATVANTHADMDQQPCGAQNRRAGSHRNSVCVLAPCTEGQPSLQSALRRQPCPEYPAACNSSRKFCGIHYVRPHKAQFRPLPNSTTTRPYFKEMTSCSAT